MYVLETHHVEHRNGIVCRESMMEEHDDLKSAQKAAMLYKLGVGIGYTIYQASLETVSECMLANNNIVDQWFDRKAYRG